MEGFCTYLVITEDVVYSSCNVHLPTYLESDPAQANADTLLIREMHP